MILYVDTDSWHEYPYIWNSWDLIGADVFGEYPSEMHPPEYPTIIQVEVDDSFKHSFPWDILNIQTFYWVNEQIVVKKEKNISTINGVIREYKYRVSETQDDFLEILEDTAFGYGLTDEAITLINGRKYNRDQARYYEQVRLEEFPDGNW